MKLKPNKYYKRYYNDEDDYDILYTNSKSIYLIAYMYINITSNVLYKPKKRLRIGSIIANNRHTKRNNERVEEISESEVFLELL